MEVEIRTGENTRVVGSLTRFCSDLQVERIPSHDQEYAFSRTLGPSATRPFPHTFLTRENCNNPNAEVPFLLIPLQPYTEPRYDAVIDKIQWEMKHGPPHLLDNIKSETSVSAHSINVVQGKQLTHP